MNALLSLVIGAFLGWLASRVILWTSRRQLRNQR